MKPIRLYFHRRPGNKINFGDELSPLLLEYVTGRGVRRVRRSSYKSCEVIGVGSLLDYVTKQSKQRRMRLAKSLSLRSYLPLVWGSGFLCARENIRMDYLEIRALRGALTAALLGETDKPLGDPGLLACHLIPASSRKEYRVGVMAHYMDRDHPKYQRLLSGLSNSVELSIEAPPLETLRKIQTCDYIVSSAMHGLIAADSLGVPNLRVSFSGDLIGGDFKFEDYASAVGRSNIRAHDPGQISDSTLENAFSEQDYSHFAAVDSVNKAITASISDLIA